MKSELVISNLFWRFFERTGAQVVSFVVSIILARILEPSLFGTITLVTVFISILQVFIDGGMGNALIQKKDADDLDFSSVFFFNIVFCILLYLLIFFASPFIANYYGIQELTEITRVLSLLLIVSGVKNIQQAYVSKNLMFKKFFFATLVGTIVAAVVGVIMAVKGFGVWALVTQLLVNNCVDTVVLWIVVDWKPKFEFSFYRLKGLFSYGWKLLVSSLIDSIYNQLRTLIIGKYYSASDLAYYDQGQKFPVAIVTNINTSIDSVLLPTLSTEQDDKIRLRDMTRRAIKTSTYIIMPMMIGLIVCANSIVSLVLTDKWLFCVPYLRIFCITYAFFPIHTANLNAIKAIGRSDIFLKLEVLKKVLGLVVLVFVMKKGVMAIAYSLLFLELSGQIINTWPNKKLLDYGYLNQLMDIVPQIMAALFMGFIVSLFPLLKLNVGLTLFIQVVFGVVVYVLISKVMNIDSFYYLLGIMKNMLSRNSHK